MTLQAAFVPALSSTTFQHKINAAGRWRTETMSSKDANKENEGTASAKPAMNKNTLIYATGVFR